MFKILDILFPRFCLGCGREGSYICKDCEIFLEEIESKDGVFSLWEHEGLMENLINEIKIKGKYHITEELVERAFARIDFNLPPDIEITYVPMFKKKQKKLGFNQSELIAENLCKMLFHKKSVLTLLEKTKDNPPQSGLGPKDREKNVGGGFSYCGFLVPENVLLVDDFFVTGSTVRECIKVLKNRGVKNVWAFTLSKKNSLS